MPSKSGGWGITTEKYISTENKTNLALELLQKLANTIKENVWNANLEFWANEILSKLKCVA